MKAIVYKALWYLIHIIANIFETIYYFGLEIRENLSSFVQDLREESPIQTKERETSLIERNVQDLEKIPKHIAVILLAENERDVDLSKLTDLIRWSLYSGVHFISFYDYKGIMKHQLKESLKLMMGDKFDTSDRQNVVFGPDYQNSEDVKFPGRNGYKNHIIVNLYSFEDSYGMFGQLLKDKDSDLTSENVTIELIDKKIAKLFGHLPEPELGVYFGNVTCTAGLLPWHIRLTEFHQISYKQNHLSLDKYLRVLFKYAKCEQRLGK